MSNPQRVVPQTRIIHDETLQNSHIPLKEPLTLDDVAPSIIYLDDNYCVIDKPPGIRMDGNFPITIEKLVAKWTNRGIKEIKWMHQLDFATSGILCIGLHREAVAAVVSSFEHRSVRKAYLAVLQGYVRVEDWPEMSAEQAIRYNDSDISEQDEEALLEKGRKLVEEHRKALVSTGRNPKRKLQDVANNDSGSMGNKDNNNLPLVTNPGSTWQEQVMLENLQICLKAFQSLTLERVVSIDTQLQADYEYLLKYTEAEFIKSPKLRKLLRKLLTKCGLQVELVASSMTEATSVLPTAALAVETAQAVKQSQPLSEEEVARVCEDYRNPCRIGGPAIFRLKSSIESLLHITPTNPSVSDNNSLMPSISKAELALQQQFQESPFFQNQTPASQMEHHHLLIDIPVAELDGDFRMEPGHEKNPGKKAVTEVFVLAHGYYQGQPVTKVLMKPISGRRHQLRIHSLCMGHPIVGDFTYNPLQKQGIAFRNGEYQAFVAEHGVEHPIPLSLRQAWDNRVAERMMLHAYCIYIPFPNGGRSSVPYKRKLLQAEWVQQRLRQWETKHVLATQEERDTAKATLAAEIRQEFDKFTTLQIRDMTVVSPLIDIATPIDPFVFHRNGSSEVVEDASLVLQPVVPSFMQRHYNE